MPPSRSIEEVKSQFQYTRWGNGRMLEALQAADAPPDRAVELFSHLLRTQDVWYGRVQDTDHAELDFWAVDSLAACADRLAASTERWQARLAEWTGEDLGQPVVYQNSTGTRYETPLRDILFHVVNHGTHHRAQMARVLRQADIPPPATDYIFFLRDE
jgi:uncharacterized damage-inducible protein DinB